MGSDGTHSPPAYPVDAEKRAVLGGAVDSNGKRASDVNLGRLSLDSGTKLDQTHRLLKSRHIQLIGIGGSIGTVLYVRPREIAPLPPPPRTVLVTNCLL